MAIKALIYVRDFYRLIHVKQFSGIDDFLPTFVFDFPKQDHDSIQEIFYRYYETDKKYTGFSLSDVEDICIRCRLLRNLDSNTAHAMVNAMALTIHHFLTKDKFTCVITPAIDNYVTDLFARIGERLKIRHIGICESYFPGYTYITRVCAPAYDRTVSDEEAIRVLDSVLVSDFRRDYGQITYYNFLLHIRLVAKYRIKQIVFNALRILRSDPKNFHYLCYKYTGDRKALRDYPNRKDFHRDWQLRLEKASKPVIYLPLSFTPEMSTDYWVNNTTIIEYESIVIKMCYLLREHFTVLVKDHFHMSGIRKRNFFHTLSNIEGVINVPPGVNSNNLLEKSDKVLVGSGSAGIEALLRGQQNVYSYCEQSVWFPVSGIRYLDLNRMESWLSDLQQPLPKSIIEPLELIKSCLRATIEFRFNAIEANNQLEKRQSLLHFTKY